MNRSRAFSVSAVLAMVAAGFAACASAYTGDDPVLASGIAACTYSDIKARIDQFGDASYKVYGSCSGSAVSGQMAYKDGKFQESFIANNATISTLGYCDTDPWATAVNCHDQKVGYTGAFDPGLLNDAPLSLISGNYQEFHNAYLNASRPNPPGLPVNFTATADYGKVTAHWLAPDTSGDRPFIGFILQARPQHAEGAAWVAVGLIFAHTQPDYEMKKPLPATSAAIRAWDVRLCSTTNLSSTCTPALTPGSDLVTEAAERNDHSAAYTLASEKPSIALTQVTEANNDRAIVAALASTTSPTVAFARVHTDVASPPAPVAAPDLDALAVVGAKIAEQDPVVAEARSAEVGAFYQLGFDVASGIFGDPKLGALGHTLTGPGSDKIRDSLSAAGQRGFNASVAFHLARDYKH